MLSEREGGGQLVSPSWPRHLTACSCISQRLCWLTLGAFYTRMRMLHTPATGSRLPHFSHSIALATFSHSITRHGNHPRQPPTAANRAQPSLTCLLLSVHVCVAYNTVRQQQQQQQQHSRRPPLFVCVARQHSDSMAHTYIHTFMRLYMCVCVCVRCQGHWQKAEVLLGSDFSFLFASAAMPFRVRAFCAAPSV